MQNEVQVPLLEDDDAQLAAVRQQGLPETVVPLIDTYEEIVGDRDRFLWRWLYHLFPSFRLSCVDADRGRMVRDTKLIATMYIVVADDVAERHADRATFDELAAIPFDGRRPDPDRSAVDGDVVRFLTDLWDRFEAAYDAGPRAAEFADLLRFDLRQALQAIEYSYLANRHPSLVSEQELWRYDARNMLMFVYADIDLANASSFDSSELSSLRQVIDRTERMARIGNWLSTWKRELDEGDWCSGVVVHALESGIISQDQLQSIRQQPTDASIDSVVDAISDSGVEDYFLDRWRTEYEDASRFEPDIESVDIDAYLEGFETILRYHMASEGKK
ncbi:terpene synthase family protein [Natrinema salinisoli]|uniref:terpene synthase family protein n=1 Tax=Natrinema salinisoli TaxID=2878535 RepID=UPI001CF01464|nr:hypothetical protein [Natrinema salinisoli]